MFFSLPSRAFAAALLAFSCGVAAPQGARAADEIVITQTQQAEFQRWIANFRHEALAQGISPQLFDRAFAGARLNAKVMKADRRQPEFSRPIWDYLESAVSDKRISKGREKLALHGALLETIGRAYGVDPHIALAIWGVESNYGSYYGDYSIIEALATLAFDGRRAKWAKKQLLTALKILQAGDIAPERMKGSWAGAMGHTQFIPTSFEAYAVDFTGDGRRDLWGADPADALASAANYLKEHKWRTGAPIVIEVTVPRGIDFLEFDEKRKKPVAEWLGMGVRAANGRPLPVREEAAIILPAGAKGPAFMIFHNFGVIRRYNNAVSYALAVAHLAERIRGGAPFRHVWPEGERPLSRAEKKEMQEKLTALGFDTGGVDGMLGPNSRAAIRAFQRAQGLDADSFPTASLLERVRQVASGAQPVAALGPDAIMEIQARLAQLGYNPGPVDGAAGSRTIAAIAAFQRARGLHASGAASWELLAALRASSR